MSVYFLSVKGLLFMSVYEINHPLVKHKIGLLRKAGLSTKSFRELCSEIGTLLTYEATKHMPTEKVEIDTWSGKVEVDKIKGKKVTVVPILRAGIGMMDGVLNLIPSARISVVGLYRDEETLRPVPYFQKFAGEIENRLAIVVDPMLATGGSLIAAINMLKEAGCTSICGLFLVAAPEGIKALEEKHPDVDIFVASVDDRLNEQGYILPGLGDAGDKLFGTK